MFYSITEHQTKFVHEISQLLMAVPLCARTVILFFSNSSFYHYSLVDEKVLYQSKLPGKPHRAVAISATRIAVSVSDCSVLFLLDIKEQGLFEICKIPTTSIPNEGKAKQIFYNHQIESFKKTGGLYLCEQNNDQRKTKITYMNSKGNFKQTSFQSKQLALRGYVCDKADQHSQLAIFKQNIDTNGTFKFRIVDLSQDFEERQYSIQHKAFTIYTTVCQIKKIKKEKYLIFANSASPQIVIVDKNEAYDYPYTPTKMFIMSVLINTQLNYGIFQYFSDKSEYSNCLELMDLQSGRIINQADYEINYIVKAWEDDYFLDYKRDARQTTHSTFCTRHIIDKKTHYMKLLQSLKFSANFSDSFNEQVIDLLS